LGLKWEETFPWPVKKEATSLVKKETKKVGTGRTPIRETPASPVGKKMGKKFPRGEGVTLKHFKKQPSSGGGKKKIRNI